MEGEESKADPSHNAEQEQQPPPKGKLGRPPEERPAEETEQTQKKRGRPKVSKNKPKESGEAMSETQKKRGRPRKHPPADANDDAEQEPQQQPKRKHGRPPKDKPARRTQPTPIGIANTHPHDVLTGRGKGSYNHPGNAVYRTIIEKNKASYKATPKASSRKYFAGAIVDAIYSQDPPGRFLRMNKDDKLWYEISRQNAMIKAAQALRENKHNVSELPDDEIPAEFHHLLNPNGVASVSRHDEESRGSEQAQISMGTKRPRMDAIIKGVRALREKKHNSREVPVDEPKETEEAVPDTPKGPQGAAAADDDAGNPIEGAKPRKVLGSTKGPRDESEGSAPAASHAVSSNDPSGGAAAATAGAASATSRPISSDDLPVSDSARQNLSSGTEWEVKYGYSRAVRRGEVIHVSGTVASGPDGVVGEGDPAAQARHALGKIRSAVEDLGGQMEDVVRTRIYVSHREHALKVAEVHGEVFEGIRPANTLVIAGLIDEKYLVEIEAEALIGSGRQVCRACI